MISCIPVLVHKGWYFCTDHETTDDITPTVSPIIIEAHSSIEPEDALTPKTQQEKKAVKTTGKKIHDSSKDQTTGTNP